MKLILAFFVVSILTACQSNMVAEMVTQPGQVLYYDDFSDRTSGWTQTTSEYGRLEYANNAYRMQVLAPGYDLRAVSGQIFRDVQLEVDATRLGGPINNRFGLICRFQDMSNYYFFIITSDGYYAIGKLKNGSVSLLGQNMMAYSSAILVGSRLNHLRLDCIGNSLTGYINDQATAITSDADFSSGDAGLITGAFDQSGVDLSFYNFMVIKP